MWASTTSSSKRECATSTTCSPPTTASLPRSVPISDLEGSSAPLRNLPQRDLDSTDDASAPPAASERTVGPTERSPVQRAVGMLASSAGFAGAVCVLGGGSDEYAEGVRGASEGGRSPPPSLD